MPQEEYEIIIVDDCSTDNSWRVCQDYAERFPNSVQAFQTSQNTGGPSTGRNIGLKKAQGKYVIFLDSDLFIDAECFIDLYEFATRKESDAVVACMQRLDSDNTVLKTSFQNTRQLIPVAHYAGMFGPLALYKLSTIQSIDVFFDEELNYGEDRIFNYRFLYSSSSIRFSCLGEKPLIFIKDYDDDKIENTNKLTKKTVHTKKLWINILRQSLDSVKLSNNNEITKCRLQLLKIVKDVAYDFPKRKSKYFSDIHEILTHYFERDSLMSCNIFSEYQKSLVMAVFDNDFVKYFTILHSQESESD
jgi:glycosyltransferase involved in cell wall biosynthesis